MAKSKQNIGATLSLKDGGFFANIKSAQRASDELKGSLGEATGEVSAFSGVMKSIGGGVTTAVKGIAAVTAAVVGVTAAVGGMALAVGQDYTSASNSLAAQTGVAGVELDSLNESMKDIYSQNYGESFEDIASSIAIVKQQAKDMPTEGIEQMTTDALALRDTFEFDVSESVRSANMLMTQFGLSGEEAYSLIAQGAQSGLDKNGDLLDTINEYSVHFEQIGLDAESMFNMLENGAESGTFSVDKLGDAVKEFGIRVKDGTADTAFTQLGISVNDTKKAFAEGGEAGKKAFSDVTKALFSMDDKVQQNLIGTELFGTMWEDLGADGVKALSDINGEFDRTADTMERIKDIKYDDLGSAFEGLKRTLTVDLLLPIGEQLTPAVSDLVNELSRGVSGTALEGLAEQLGSSMSGVVSAATDVLPEVLSSAQQFFSDIAPSVDEFISSISGIGEEIKQALPEDAFETWKTGSADMMSSVISGISRIVTAAAPLIGSIVGFVVENSDTLFSISQTAIDFIVTIAELAGGLLGPAIDILFAALGPALDVVGSALSTLTDTASNVFDELQPLFDFWKNNVENLMPLIESVFSSSGIIISTALDNITEIFGFFINVFTGDWSGAWENVKNIYTNTFNGIRDAASIIYNGINEVTGGALDVARGIVTEKLANIKTSYDEHGGGIKGVVYATLEGIKGYYTAGYEFLDQLTGGKLTAIKDKFLNIWENVKTGVANIWDGIVNSVKGSINKVITTMNNMLQNAVSGINNMITNVNNISGKIGIPEIPTINAPHIALLANGGILTGATLFGSTGGTGLVGGEAGPEAILPLAKFWDNLEKYIYGAWKLQPASANGNINNYINITVSGANKDSESIAKEIAKKVKEALDNM